MRTRHLTGCGLHAIRVSQCCRSGAKAAIDWRAGSSGARYLATRSLTEVRTNDQTVGFIYKMRSDFLIAADHLPRQAPDKPKKQKETSNALAFFAENATGVPFILTADPAHDTDIVSVDSLDPGSWTVPVAVRITHLLSNLCIK